MKGDRKGGDRSAPCGRHPAAAGAGGAFHGCVELIIAVCTGGLAASGCGEFREPFPWLLLCACREGTEKAHGTEGAASCEIRCSEGS